MSECNDRQKINVENIYWIWEGTLFNFWILKPISQPRSQPNSQIIHQFSRSSFWQVHTLLNTPTDFSVQTVDKKNWEKVHTLNRVWDYLPIPQRLKFINFFTPEVSLFEFSFKFLKHSYISYFSDFRFLALWLWFVVCTNNK